jgi:hypothetical protein
VWDGSEWEWKDNRFAFEPYFHICPGCEKKDLLSMTRIASAVLVNTPV